jgi:hypothetical protein
MSFLQFDKFEFNETIFLPKMKTSLRMRSFLILVGLHLYPGTYVPNIYHMSTRTVLSVLSHVAFTLPVQNYLCTILPLNLYCGT